MKYIDYDWDLHHDKIVIDSDINIDKLGWKAGDHFELININGKVILQKVDPVVKFVKGYL
jgi:hypothetical protein